MAILTRLRPTKSTTSQASLKHPVYKIPLSNHQPHPAATCPHSNATTAHAHPSARCISSPHSNTLPCLPGATGCCGHACTGQHTSHAAGGDVGRVCARAVPSRAGVIRALVRLRDCTPSLRCTVICSSTLCQHTRTATHDVGNTAPRHHAPALRAPRCAGLRARPACLRTAAHGFYGCTQLLCVGCRARGWGWASMRTRALHARTRGQLSRSARTHAPTPPTQAPHQQRTSV